MSFVSTQPAVLTVAAANLPVIGSVMGAQNAGGIAPATGVVPPAGDEVLR